MNSDGAYDQLDGGQYVFGYNVRTTKNQFLGDKDDYASVHEGIITPVPEGLHLDSIEENIGKILAVKSVDRMGIIITSVDTTMRVYRLYLDERDNSLTGFTKLWEGVVWKEDKVPEQVSAVLYKELDNVIKLYIADGVHPIICMRVDEEGSSKLATAQLDDLINNRIVPTERIFIDEVISGRLLTSQVQYTYRYYNKYGNTTQLAPLTNKIQVINPSRSKEIGNAENTETSIGFSLKINCINKYNTKYDRLQVFRLQYVTPGADAEVYLIYDGKVKTETTDTFVLNDVGVDPLQQYSMEEFAAMSGIILVPQVIEQNQEYMFCGNVIDDTILQSEPIVTSTPTTVEADVVLSEKLEGDIPDEGDHKYTSDDKITDGLTIPEYFEQRGINSDIVKSSYNNIFTSSLLRSLRRGETYKYAIVYYDKFGRRTDVKSIGSVDVASINESKPFVVENGVLKARPIGVKINIPQFAADDEDAKNIIGCQIVRRASSEIYQKNLLQVALARPVQQGLLDFNISDGTTLSEDNVKKSPFYPSGFLTTTDLVIQMSIYENLTTIPALWTKTKNTQLYQIFSQEIDFRRDDVLSRLNTSDTKLSEVLYVPAIFARYTNNTKDLIYDGTLPSSINAIGNSQQSSGTVTTISAGEYGAFEVAENIIDINSSSIIFTCNNSDMGTIYIGYTNKDGVMTHSEYVEISFGENIINQIREVWNNKQQGTALHITSDRWSEGGILTITQTGGSQQGSQNSVGSLYIDKYNIEKLKIEDKQARHWIFNFFDPTDTDSGFNEENVPISQIKDVKMADWNSGFDQVQHDSDNNIATAIKKYRSFATNIGKFTYNNWVSFGKYDLRAGNEDEVNQDWGESEESQEMLAKYGQYIFYLENNGPAQAVRNGYIGPGGSCFILTTEEETGGFNKPESRFYTSICNITHNPKLEDVQSDEFTPYYGFGNYFNLEYNNGELKTTDGRDYLIVFDGDVYITPHEFTTLYKTYNFESVDTLQSTQITNYIPLESKVNTYFDYGMNLRNTNSENLLYEPGSIDSITTQERPAHQYNMIYSDNDASNDVFTLISTDKNETNNFKQRTYYSEVKSNGEFIDNFLIFKAAAFIDVDSKYGQITNLLTDRNTLYYWQDTACGKFSVNERSLVNDQNSNTIMLGQAGILSRYDYLSTKYGMRLWDFCAISSEAGVFWVDVNNKAIAALQQSVVNYGERLNVQNIINDRISDDVPHVSYDLQNNELVCKCFNNAEQIVFNAKFNIATSLYNREYDNILDIKNHQYGLKVEDGKLNITKYNYLPYQKYEYLTPMNLQFVVNPMASVTKVYDSQQIVPIKRDSFTAERHVLENTTLAFETDIVSKTYGTNMEPYTDREGNLIYNVPRFENKPYGNRIRGKWMRVAINKNEPTELFTLSHVITKFRQSFS